MQLCGRKLLRQVENDTNILGKHQSKQAYCTLTSVIRSALKDFRRVFHL